MFPFVVMIKVVSVIFINFMTQILPPFQAEAEMRSQISFSCLTQSHPSIQVKQNSSLIRSQEIINFIIFNQFYVICTNLMLPFFIFILFFNPVNAVNALFLKY